MTIQKLSKILVSFSFILILSCTTSYKRILTDDEMKKFGIYGGIIHDVPICPHTFDDKNQKLIIIGECEIVNCTLVENKSICYSEKKRHNISR
jgi:hypothetical protein